MICDTCKFLIDSVDDVKTPMGSFPVHTLRCKRHETCGGEWCKKYEPKEGEAKCHTNTDLDIG